jgi:hypothetical protein
VARALSDALVCLSLANLCFVHARFEILFTGHRGYFSSAPLSVVPIVVLAVQIVALAGVFYASGRLVRRGRWRWLRWVARVAGTLLLLLPLNFLRVTSVTGAKISTWLGIPLLLAVAVALVVVVAVWSRTAWRLTRGLALIMSPLIALVAGQGALRAWEVWHTPDTPVSSPPPIAGPATTASRVVWIVFDELDHRLVFETPPAGLTLPELGRFREGALMATAAGPPALATDLALPALILGRRVIGAKPLNHADLNLVFSDGSSGAWSAQPNVFDRARALGATTALVGWYLPYPRSIGHSVHAIHWAPAVVYEQARGRSWTETAVNQLGTLVRPMNTRRLHRDRFVELRERSLAAVADARAGFVMLHVPVPHAPGIYHRASGALTAWRFGAVSEYFDNLALADRFLGDVRRAMERRGRGTGRGCW